MNTEKYRQRKCFTKKEVRTPRKTFVRIFQYGNVGDRDWRHFIVSHTLSFRNGNRARVETVQGMICGTETKAAVE